MDAVTSTYHNLLTVTSGIVEDYIGSFSCTVHSNGRNYDSGIVNINGRYDMVVFAIIIASYNPFL